MSTGDPCGHRDDSPVSRERGFCPCCGYRTPAPDTPGSYEVCPVCYWLDDLVAFYRRSRPSASGLDPEAVHAPDYESNYHHLSLREARRNVRAFGAVSREAVERTRDPKEEVRDPNWPYE